MAKLSASILTADFSDLRETLALFERHPAVGWLHMDVMDGAYVPNISFGPPVVRSLARATGLPLDIHLMVEEPGRLLGDFKTEKTEYITVHQEACTHLDRALRQIRDLGVRCGAALNPATPEGTLDYALGSVDQVLVMSVNPGFGGQRFIPDALRKVRALAEERSRRGLSFQIAVDGGVNADNVAEIRAAGADIIVTGSAVLDAPDPAAELALLAKNMEGADVCV
ncbi:MAG: ribulose-phosphate 3-epimerase [Clostridiales bacterium]|nr:ribulose-phosphate 3-epimerase [Clostridiales bacterium]